MKKNKNKNKLFLIIILIAVFILTLLLIKLSDKVNGATRLQKLVFSVQSEGRKNKYWKCRI